MPTVYYSTRSVTEATPAAVAVIKTYFPSAITDLNFIESVVSTLDSRGFKRGSSIAFINTCRDESSRPFASLIDEQYGASFNITGLGGVITAGTVGFKAGMSHSPISDGREKYIFFAFPHIAVSEKGSIGDLWRPGREEINHACGALIALKGIAKDAKPKKKLFSLTKIKPEPLDFDNLEFSVLKTKILESELIKRAGEEGPDLVTVTIAAIEVINNDLEKIVRSVVDISKADYAVVTGVQIHSGAQIEGEPFQWDRFLDYISPSLSYTVVNGMKEEFSIT